MVPRNLRKPTQKRVEYWWKDFLVMWYRIGHWHLTVSLPDDD